MTENTGDDMTTATQTAISAPADFRFKDKRTYGGTVTGQYVQMSKADVPELILTVKLKGELVNGRNPRSGFLPLPDNYEIEAKLRFDSSNPTVMEYALNDLARLGFTGDDISTLNPLHDSPVLFKGKEVFVAPTYKLMGSSENCYWNLRFPTEGDPESVAVEDLQRSPAADEFRRLMAERNKKSSSATTGEGEGEAPEAGAKKRAKKVPF